MLEHFAGLLADAARRAGIAGVPRRAVIAAACVAVCAVGFGLWRWWPAPEPAGLDLAGAPVAEARDREPRSEEAAAHEPTATPIVVHVAGAVRRPGVYTLDAGARVNDAVDRAGGALPDAVLDGLNLARPVQDGEQVLVPDEDSPSPPASAAPGMGSPSGAAPAGPLDINTATAEQLDGLPGIGPSTAAKIVADREANGPFASVDDLGRVSGIGPKKVAALKDVACVR